jgi:hypothetical protein
LYFGPHRGMLSSKRHTASGKIMIAGQLALIVAAVFAGRGSPRQHRRTACAVRARRPIFAHRMEARIQTRLRDASAARGGGVSFGAIGVLADRRLAVATRSSRPSLELASSATALRSSRRISRVRLPAPTKLILEGLTKMPGFLGLDPGDCDAVQAEVNQVTSVCS